MLASSPRLDIFWCPSDHDKYIVFGSELSLYQVDKADYNTNTEQALLSEEAGTYGKLLAHNSDGQFPKCMSWYPAKDKDYLVAIGQANGNITLVSMDQKRSDDLIGREYAPKHGRPCCCVAWSVDPNSSPMLAAGLDKYRTDASLLVWDVNRLTHEMTSYASPDRHSTGLLDLADNSKLGKPLAELGSSEATNSLAWTSTNTIITGMNKYLRVVDMRDPTKFVKTTQTKAVYGICLDPQNEERGMASYIENQVYIWDMRMFDKALYTLPTQSSSIVKLGWCPKRLGLLACLSKESTSIRVFDIQHSSSRQMENEYAFSERPVESPSGQQLTSFDWHPFDENRLLTINVSGVCSDIKMFERIALDMNPCNSGQQLCYTQVKQIGHFSFENYTDISNVMRTRALNMYGLQKNRKEQLEMLEMQPNKPETQLWRWVDHLSSLIESDPNFLRPGLSSDGELPRTQLIGVKHILDVLSSNKQMVPWQGAGAGGLTPLVHYKSEERDKCLRVCKWPCKSAPSRKADGTDRQDYVDDVTSRLALEGQYEKATAICVFHGRIDSALTILNRGADPLARHCDHYKGINLSIVAMALAGINTTNNALWLSKCRELHSKIDDPYLRATFAFLTCEGNYDQILSSKSDISIADRVAFACLFLADVDLRPYISILQSEVISDGNLSGVLVTGLEEAGVDLLQKYIDNTGDIQTATLIMIHSFPSRLQEDERVNSWIDDYKNLLDQWKLWVLRARFDIFHKDLLDKAKGQALSQVYLSCNYCSKANTPLQMQQRRMYTAGGYVQKPNTVKIAICNECRKPLPRCTLCLKYMGTSSGVLSAARQDSHTNAGSKGQKQWKKPADLNATANFANWFTWCQSCRHGGHSIHIEQWFRSNIECPVSGCTCKCLSLDSIPPLHQLELDT